MTTYFRYNPDGAINSFFNLNTTVTRQQCDEYALSRAGGVVTALKMQGVCSYTVTAGPSQSKLFQFREEHSTINMENISLAKTIQPEFVASCKFLGTLGDSRPVYIYEMNRLPGIAHIMARISPDDMDLQRNIIKDFAKYAEGVLCFLCKSYLSGRFIAQSWNHDLQLDRDTTVSLLAEFQSSFDLLARDLPSRFTPNLQRVRNELSSLFSKALPFVLTHGDLNAMNILVDPSSGHITGIVDWAEARILPFGFALYGLETFLGRMDSEGWHYYDHYSELESLFWETFREQAQGFSDADLDLARVARMAGLFHRYGLDFDSNGVVKGVRMSQPDGSFPYLDPFCTASEWAALFYSGS